MLAAPIGLMLGMVLILGLIPALVMGGLYVDRGRDDVEIIDRELVGVELLHALKPMEAFVIAQPTDEAERVAAAKKHLQTIKSLKDTHNYSEAFALGREFEQLSRRLTLIAGGAENVDAAKMYETLIIRIGDKSGLILDPQLDTYYLMTISLNGSREIARLNQDLAANYARTTDRRDPLIIAARRDLANATTRLGQSANSAVEGSKYDLLAKGNFITSVNSTINAVNRMNDAVGQDWPTARTALDAANRKTWDIATFSLQALLEQRRSEAVRSIWISVGISGAAALLVTILASLVIIAITDGVKRITGRLHDLADGDYLSDVPGTHYRNDIGVIANALQDFIELSGKVDEERLRAKAELEETVAAVRRENDGLLAAAVEQQRKSSEQERETLARLAADLERQIGALLQGSQVAAEKMDAEASAMADRSSEVKREASQAAHVAADIRNSVEPVPETVRTVVDSLDKYSLSLSEANRLAAAAAAQVQGANRRMTEFTQATSKAATMLALITQVAQKTNMLALNASIEAVRVGEAGKGFEVVANEVKALANSTRDTANEIAAQIGAMEGANREVSEAFAEIMQIVETLAQQSASVADGMSCQTEAIGRVHLVVADAASQLAQMVSSIEAADRSATATRNRSSEMLAASKGVSENIGALDGSVRAFLRDVQESRPIAA
jgi:methyl-accepting chemotaxis protein